MQQDDEIVFIQDDLYVITCETDFGDFEATRRSETHSSPNERSDTNEAADTTQQRDQILADVDLRSTRSDATEIAVFDETNQLSSSDAKLDYQKSQWVAILLCPKY